MKQRKYSIKHGKTSQNKDQLMAEEFENIESDFGFRKQVELEYSVRRGTEQLPLRHITWITVY